MTGKFKLKSKDKGFLLQTTLMLLYEEIIEIKTKFNDLGCY